MKRLIIATFALALAASSGCSDAGNEKRCKQAIKNIFSITGLDKTGSGPDVHAAVRSCRAHASNAGIDCMIAARTVDDLAKCDGKGDLLGKDAKDDANKKEESGKGE